jgi:hypothetical protein
VAKRQARILKPNDLPAFAARTGLVRDRGQGYKAVFRTAVLRANRIAMAGKARAAMLPPALKFHALRHTCASLCFAGVLALWACAETADRLRTCDRLGA